MQLGTGKNKFRRLTSLRWTQIFKTSLLFNMFGIPTSKNPVAPLILAARLQAETVLIAKWEDLQKINKRGGGREREREGGKKKRRWESRIGRYIWQEKERKRETETGQINQGQYLQYLGLCSARSTKTGEREEGKGRGEERRRSENILGSVYKKKENTHTYTPEG